MEELIKLDHSNGASMSSLEIAELTGKQHTHVIRDIRAQLEAQGIDQSKYGSIYQDTYGRDQNSFGLDYEQTMILISGYSIPIRAIIIKRWRELENKGLVPNFSDPVEAARAWADEYEARQISENRINRLVHNTKTYTTTEIAKELGFTSARKFNQTLNGEGIIYKDSRGVWLLRAEYSDKGFQNIKQKEVNDNHTAYYAEWTGIGREWLIGLFEATLRY